MVQNYGIDHGAADNGVIIVDQDPNLCEFGFICHEMGHRFGLEHSYSTDPDMEYGDAWDLMSFATSTRQFDIHFEGAVGSATWGLNGFNLEKLGVIPHERIFVQSTADFSTWITLDPLNQTPIGSNGFLFVKISPNATRPIRSSGSTFIFEFRQKSD